MEPELIAQITRDAVRMALQQDREERDHQSRIATEAAVAAALANQTSQVQALRQPDLPPFDKDHIDVWIGRVEFAYARAGVTKPTDKFAFLEKMFHAKDDSKVNAFLWGAHNDSTWSEFVKYLRERHGRTKKQEVYSLLDGVQRDGRRPTALAELIKELTPRVTVDDIRKEVLLKQMPACVRQHLNDKIDDLDFMVMAHLHLLRHLLIHHLVDHGLEGEDETGDTQLIWTLLILLLLILLLLLIPHGHSHLQSGDESLQEEPVHFRAKTILIPLSPRSRNRLQIPSTTL